MYQGKSIRNPYVVSIVSILAISSICFLIGDIMHYQITALILLLGVSLLAILYEILPVTIAALLSALLLNVFFIDPVYHYKIDSAENILLFFIFLFVALVNAVLTNKIKRQKSKMRDREDKDKLIKLYDTLLNSLSHELRTPISTIIGGIDTLKVYDTLLSVQHRNDLLDEMEIASIRLDRQVGNLLNMNRLETGNLALKKDWSDISELIFLTVGKLPKHSHRLDVHMEEDLPLFKIDSGLLEQVIYMLIHNAVIYSHALSDIFIKVDHIDEKLRIVVSDNGPGIPDELKDRVFEKFYRLPQSKTGGSGLGLSIAKGFVEAHGGTITLANTQEHGAMFTLIIPAEVSYLNNLKHE